MSFDPTKHTLIGTSSNAKFYELDEEVLVVVPDDGSHDDGESAAESIRVQVEYLREKNRRSGVVVLMDSVLNQNAGARAVYRDHPDKNHQACFALVGGTPFSRAVCSIFVTLSPPGAPTRVFGDFNEAVAWARSMARNHG